MNNPTFILYPEITEHSASEQTKQKKKGCKTYFNKKDHLWTHYEYETGAFNIPENAKPGMLKGGCNCGNFHITILPSGDIYACRRAADSRSGMNLKIGLQMCG